MYKLIVAAALASIIGFSLYQMSAPTLDDSKDRQMFNQWCMQNGKAFGNDDEKEYRFHNFKLSMREVEQHTSGDYQLELNEFADLDTAEFISQYTGARHLNESMEEDEEIDENLENVEAPAEWDWVARGYVNEVQNQGRCGSCWTFGSTASLEFLHKKTTGKLEKFAEQAMVDCGHETGNRGCNGGTQSRAFKWSAMHGMALEKDYPYTARVGSCKIASKNMTKINRSYRRVRSNSNSALVDAIYGNVVAVAIYAGKIKLYKRGVFSDWTCSTRINHMVNAVGYGRDAATGKYFWKVRNSWGSRWGDGGYIKMERRSSGRGICGITNQSFYPVA